MIIEKPGKYKLLSDLKTRGTISVGTIPAGTMIEITQVDHECRKVIGPQLLDWHYWDIHAKEADDGNQR